MKYILYRADGSHEIIERAERMAYDDLSKFTPSGMIEFSQHFEGAEDGSVLMIDEEGMLNDRPVANPFFTPLYQEFFAGDILQGVNVMTEEGLEFSGFSDDVDIEKFLRKPKALSPLLFQADKVFTLIGIGGFMANTTRNEVKSVGRESNGNPIFKENRKGVRKMFTLRNLKDKDIMIFEGADLPFKVDGEVSRGGNGGFTSRTMRGNALYNLCGDINEIRQFVKEKNINPFFTSYDRINHIGDDNETETLVFMDKFASCKLVADRQTAQHRREGRDVEVGVGFSVAAL